jgi:hypothetical protein
MMPTQPGLEIILKAFSQGFRAAGAGDRECERAPDKYMRHSEWRWAGRGSFDYQEKIQKCINCPAQGAESRKKALPADPGSVS